MFYYTVFLLYGSFVAGTYDGVITIDDVNYEDANPMVVAVEEDNSGGAPVYEELNVASNAFANDMFQLIREYQGNLLTCPVSLELVLACTSVGARDRTQAEIRNALHVSNNDDAIKSGYQSLLTSLKSDSLTIVTQLFIDSDFEVKESFKHDAETYFNSGVQTVDFFTNPQDAVKTINLFIEDKTDKAIKQVLEEGSVDQTTKCLLANVVYFLAEWENKFPKDMTRVGDFYVTSEQTKDVDLMSQTANFMYKDDDSLGAQIAELAYKGKEFKMVIILPHEDVLLKEVEDKIMNSQKNKPQVIDGLKSTKLDLTIPKFQIDSALDVKDYLIKLGVKSLFKNANLEGISEEGGLTVSKIVQKTRITISEDGTEAVAASSSAVSQRRSLSAPPIEFCADRPFLFVLVHNKADLVLFQGRYESPSEK